MDVVSLVGGTVASLFVGAFLSSMATFAFVYAVSLIPTYVALYRKHFRRAILLSWVVLVADLGLMAFPPAGAAIWLLALVYAFLPRKTRRRAVAVA